MFGMKTLIGKLVLFAGVFGLLGLSASVAVVNSWSSSPLDLSSALDNTMGEIRFVAQNTAVTAHGMFHDWSFTNLNIMPDNLAESVVEIEIDIGSIDTGHDARDEHLVSSHFFDVARYPTAHLKIQEIEALTVNEVGVGSYVAELDVALHGIAKTYEIIFDVTSMDPIEIFAELTLNRMDFSVGEAFSAINPTSIYEDVPITITAIIPLQT